MAVTIYRIPQVALLVAPSPGARQMNLPQYRTDFRLFRYIDNEIDFLIRDIDRKIPVLSDIGSIVLFITDPLTNRGVFSRTLAVSDISQGLFKLFILADEVQELPSNGLRYTVVYTRSDGVEQVLFTDQFHKQSGSIEIADGPVPPAAEPQDIDVTTLINGNGNVRKTSPLIGGSQHGNTSGAHSLVVKFSGFTGIVKIQASLSTQPDVSDASWFDVAQHISTLETGNRLLSFDGNFIWVRFIITTVMGSITGLSYRN